MKHILIIVFTTILAFGSCTEKIDLDLNQGENNRLVVEGSITTEYKIHQVKLTRTSAYFQNQKGIPELNALVSIRNNDTTINLFDIKNNGTYLTDRKYAGKTGKKYTLQIKLANGQEFSASETILPVSQMDSVKYQYIKPELPFNKTAHYHINIFVREDPAPGNYYQWEIFMDGNHVTDTLRLKVFASDEYVNGSYLSNWTIYRIPETKLRNEQHEIKVQMLSVSKEKYTFYYAILLETIYSGSAFSGTPANVPSNISNGALGFFSASAVSESTLIIQTN
jgi:hypothetical protein